MTRVSAALRDIPTSTCLGVAEQPEGVQVDDVRAGPEPHDRAPDPVGSRASRRHSSRTMQVAQSCLASSLEPPLVGNHQSIGVPAHAASRCHRGWARRMRAKKPARTDSSSVAMRSPGSPLRSCSKMGMGQGAVPLTTAPPVPTSGETCPHLSPYLSLSWSWAESLVLSPSLSRGPKSPVPTPVPDSCQFSEGVGVLDSPVSDGGGQGIVANLEPFGVAGGGTLVVE
jgi:hypothetical protein